MKSYFSTAILSLLLPMIALSQWSTNPNINNPINTMTGEQAIPKIATCPNGDSYIASFSNENGNYNVRMQRLDSQGNNLWATNGILISDNPQETWLTDWDMTADNSNYAILAFPDIRNGGNFNIVAYRIAPDGSFAWGADGIELSNSTVLNASPKVTVTSAGNAVIAWQAEDVTIMQKISPSGSLLWGPDGITISGTPTYSWPQLLPVGTDEVILKYFEDTGPYYSPTRHIIAQRYDADGDPVWASPTEVSSAGGITAWTQVLPFINDGSDGFYIAWHDQRFGPSSPPQIYVQHINSDGQAVFTTNGVDVSNSTNMLTDAALALPPGSSSIYVFYNEIEPIYQNDWGISGQKISSAGAKLWGANGIPIIAVSSVQTYIVDTRKSPSDMVIFYEEYTDYVNIVFKATRINTDGNIVWPSQIVDVSSVISEKVHPVVNEFANNQWILSWEDDRSGESDIYAQNIQLNGDLGPIPLEGTIEGTVTLIGGSASVTLVSVEAGEIVTNPDATGFYSMVIPEGTYDVIGSLVGYEPDTAFGVVVVADQTTDGVDLTLQALPTGFITGTVVLTEGSGDVTDVEVTAGYHTVNPDASGDYLMEIEIGTYDVTAALAGYVAETNPGIVVLEGMTTGDVDFELSLIPTTGFISGMVLLQNSAGDVTQVEVTAGTVTVNPDATGYYIMEITAGTWEVTASLIGFYTGVVQGVVVVVGQTTPDVDFFLYEVPDVGYIEGLVTLVNGTGDVTEATVTAGGQTTNPMANGSYFLTLPEGNYTVTASHPYTLSDSITGVAVVTGSTTENVNFELEIVRANLICKALDTYNNILNGVNVEITGPEGGDYSGIITDDSLTFENLPYGMYNGSAWMYDIEPVYADAELGEFNHEIIFIFDLTGLKDQQGLTAEKLEVSPNPFSEYTGISFKLNEPSAVSLIIYSQQGQLIRTLVDAKLNAGIHQMTWDGETNSGQIVSPGMYTVVLQTLSGKLAKVLIKRP